MNHYVGIDVSSKHRTASRRPLTTMPGIMPAARGAGFGYVDCIVGSPRPGTAGPEQEPP
jgi:hypothetical protein